MKWLACWAILFTTWADDSVSSKPFGIQVIDESTGRGVPLVELTTVHRLRFLTDSQGYIAFQEPGLMNQDVFFFVKSHGYEHVKDGFGYQGKTFKTTPGGKATIKVQRKNIAERLYRVTGAGIYRDTILIGAKAPISKPLLNAGVLGSDSVLTTVFQNKVHWFWGDTNFSRYPLGLFHSPGATSLLPSQGGLDPSVGVNLDYFLDKDGKAKGTANLPGQGPTWLSGLVVVEGRMFAHYVKVKPPMTIYERGLVEWNSEAQEFRKVATFPDLPTFPSGGHPITLKEQGVEYVVYCDPYPRIRVKANIASLSDLNQYEGYSCLEVGERAKTNKIEKDEQGQPRWGWKANTEPIDPGTEANWVRQGKLKPNQAWMNLRDVETGKIVSGHRGSVSWNAHRQRFVMIACQMMGTSLLGEIWYAEAPSLMGPWMYARKIMTHDRYSFYNPKHHPFFDQDGGRIIYFEGTYTQSFSGNPDQTPGYDYNQIMYRLNLDDPGLMLPVPIEQDPKNGELRIKTGHATMTGNDSNPIVFWAWDRAAPGSVKLAENPGLHVLAPDSSLGSKVTVPLHECRGSQGEKRFSLGDRTPPGFERQPQPIAKVWPHLSENGSR